MSLIRVIDFETTGLEPTDKVCESGWADYDTEKRHVSFPRWNLHRVDAIPPEVRAVHHISAAITVGEQPFEASATIRAAVDCGVTAFAAHKMDFEAQWLGDAGGLWLICTYKAALRIWPDAPSHGNMALRYWLEDQGLIELDPSEAQPAHRAAPDAYVTAHVLKALFAAGATGAQLVGWTKKFALLQRCPIGDHRGKVWADVPRGFLEWMVGKAKDMDAEKIWNAQRELDRRDGR